MMKIKHAPHRGTPPRPSRRNHSGEVGQVLVLVALLLPVLIAMLGLVVDLGVGFASRRTAQNTADSVSYAGALLIGDNDPNCISTGSTCMQFVSSDIYNAFYDAIKLSDAPNSANPTIHLYDPTAGGAPANTLGTIDVAASYVNAAGAAVGTSGHGGSSYLYDDTTPIPNGASGLSALVSWPQPTFFGKALHWNQYAVGASAGFTANVDHPSKVVLAPFAVWWDPPYGPCYAQQITATATLPCTTTNASQGQPAPPPPTPYSWTAVCGVNAERYPCPQNPAPAGQSLDDPSTAYPYGPPPGTKVLIFSNSYVNDSGATNAALNPTIDPNYQLSSNDYKGYFGYTGSQPTCLGSYVAVTGNGNDGHNALSALKASLTMLPGKNIGVATFGLADQAIKNGSVSIHVFGAVPLIVNLDDVQAAGTNGPWYGTVIDLVSPGVSTCSGQANTGNYILRLTPFQ